MASLNCLVICFCQLLTSNNSYYAERWSHSVHKVVHLSVTILDLANKNYQVLASVYN